MLAAITSEWWPASGWNQWPTSSEYTLVHGARAVMRWHGKTSPWLAGLLKRRPFNVAVVALANKLARIAWAVMTRGEDYRKPAVTAEPATV